MKRSRLTPDKILNGYYYNRDQSSYREALLQLLAIIANSYLTLDEDISKVRSSIKEMDKRQERFE
jgi:hypothetical protein|tara:strand:+ start:100 stop:294 length:195 start_codon:yes stop_codon:yes gene_type:complete